MTIAVYLLLIGIILTIFLLFLIIRSGTTQAKKIVKTEEEELHAIVHELRAPLVAIKDSASLMLNQNLDPEEQKTMLNLVHDQSIKLLEQISTILDSAKYEDGKLNLRKSLGSLEQVLKDEVALFMPEAKRKNISLASEADGTIPSFLFDQIRITEALNNLISNSLKYTNEGGKIKISLSKKDGNAVVCVSDNGIGIPAEKQKMLFTKFANINQGATEDREKLSSGLGLYITKGIIDAHKGTITIQSEVGKGTTTTIFLPIETAENISPATPAS